MSDQEKSSEEADLQFTKEKRMEIVRALVGAADKIKDQDPKLLNTALAALDGIDRQALTKMRIKSDEGISNSNSAIAQSLAHAFMDPRVKRIAQAEAANGTRTGTPELPDHLPTPEILPGEMDSGISNETYESFQKRMAAQ